MERIREREREEGKYAVDTMQDRGKQEMSLIKMNDVLLKIETTRNTGLETENPENLYPARSQNTSPPRLEILTLLTICVTAEVPPA